MKKKISFGEYFCGPGGMGLGAAQACRDLGKTPVHAFAADCHQAACRTYESNLAPEMLLCRDVREMDPATLPDIDVFLFGFPCNDFSLIGERRGLRGKFGGLYRFGVDVLVKKRPAAFVAENVSGILSAKGGAFERILAAMRRAGYRVEPRVYRFEEHGLPQARHRMIVTGIRNDIGIHPVHPEPSGKTTTCKEALEVPPIAENAPNHEKTRHPATVRERLGHIRPGENVWQAQDRGGIPEGLGMADTKVRISQIYKRLDPDKPAYTVTGSGGGGTHMYHWDEPRALTNRERARLQTFPDDFVFHGTSEDVRRQIGMAVPPQGARIVIKALVEQMEGHWPG